MHRQASFVVVSLALLGFAGVPAAAADPQESVRAAWSELDSYLGRGLRARGWRNYLLAEEFEAELASAKPNLDVLRRVSARYQASHTGLELPEFTRVSRALDLWILDLALPDVNALSELARTAPEKLDPPSGEELALAASEARAALAGLDRFLSAAPAQQAGWHKFLSWQTLQEQIGAEKPDLRAVKEIESRFYKDHPGLERPEFLRARKAVQAWSETALLADNPEFRERYTGWLNEMAEHLAGYRENPNLDAGLAIGRTLGWLERAGQAPELVEAVRHHHSSTNLVARVSQDFMAAGIEDVVNEPTSVRQNILGTSITGRGTIQGKILLEFVPSEDRATMEIVLAGTASTQNVGYKRPVTIYSSGNTELTGRKRLYVDAEGVTAGTAEAECDTRSRIHNIVAKLRLIRRIAWKKAGEQKGQAEQIASRRAEQQVAERMNQQAAEMLAEVNEGLSNNIRGPLIRLGAFPKEVKMSTTSDYFFTRILQADTAQIAAPTAPPEINEHCDLAIRMHHSSANNFAESLLAGRTLTDEQLAEYAKKLTGEVPKELEITSETEPWSITFPAAEPLRVEFGEQWVKIAIRGRQFTRSESVLTKPVDIRAEYKVETSEAGVRLVRQGDVELDFVGRTRLSVGDVAFKTFLLKKFDSLFKPELKFSDVALPGRWERAGSLQVSTFQTAAGWLSTDWNLVPRDKLADAADPAAGPAATSAKPAVEPQPTR